MKTLIAFLSLTFLSVAVPNKEPIKKYVLSNLFVHNMMQLYDDNSYQIAYGSDVGCYSMRLGNYNIWNDTLTLVCHKHGGIMNKTPTCIINKYLIKEDTLKPMAYFGKTDLQCNTSYDTAYTINHFKYYTEVID